MASNIAFSPKEWEVWMLGEGTLGDAVTHATNMVLTSISSPACNLSHPSLLTPHCFQQFGKLEFLSINFTFILSPYEILPKCIHLYSHSTIYISSSPALSSVLCIRQLNKLLLSESVIAMLSCIRASIRETVRRM